MSIDQGYLVLGVSALVVSVLALGVAFWSAAQTTKARKASERSATASEASAQAASRTARVAEKGDRRADDEHWQAQCPTIEVTCTPDLHDRRIIIRNDGPREVVRLIARCLMSEDNALRGFTRINQRGNEVVDPERVWESPIAVGSHAEIPINATIRGGSARVVLEMWGTHDGQERPWPAVTYFFKVPGHIDGPLAI